jgi:hypothetical protein
MAVKKLSFYSKAYPPVSYTGNDELFLQIGPQQVEVLVRNGLTNLPEAFEQFQLNENDEWQDVLKSILQQSELLRRNFSERHIGFTFPEVLVIPESKFSSSSTKDLCNLMFGEQPQAWIGYKKLPRSFQIMLAYRIHQAIYQWITERFPSYDTTHSYAQSIEYQLQEASPQESIVAIDFTEYSFSVTVISGAQLLLIQSFAYTTSDDVLYELLNALHQLKISPSTCLLKLSGSIPTGSELTERLIEIFPPIQWQQMAPVGIFEQVYTQFPAHYFYTLQRWLL